MRRRMTGRLGRAALWISWLVGLSAVARPAAGQGDAGWVTVWTSSPQAASGTFSDQALRLIVSPHGAGSTLRVRLTNRYASSPVTLAEVHVGTRADGAALVRGTNRRVLFDGGRSVTIAPGGTVISDPVRLDVRPFRDLAVSIRIDGATGAVPIHLLTSQTSYVTPVGSSARGDEDDGTAYTTATTASYFLSAIDVRSGRTEGAIGLLGDSITDGIASTPDTDRRWPDVLQRALLAEPRLARLAVLNAGISGNQVTRAHVAFGDAAVDRIDADLLDLAGLRAVLVLEGINDIAGNTPPRASAAEIIAGYRRLIAAARARRLPIMALTITPTTPQPGLPAYADEQALQVRREVNTWLRSSGEFDAVFDAEQALSDPAGTGVLAAAYDSGDGLHPNDDGMAAIAGAVDLDVLVARLCRGVGRSFGSLARAPGSCAAPRRLPLREGLR